MRLAPGTLLAAMLSLPGAALAMPDYATDVSLVQAAFTAAGRADYASAAQDVAIAAAAGNAQAQFMLGRLYLTGHGEPQNCPDALHWFAKAARQDDPQTIEYYGTLYQQGLCVKQDFAKALSYFQAVAEAGWPDAQISTGEIYENGQGVPRNNAAATKWFTMAASQNDPEAALDLAQLALRETPPNPVRADMWLMLARKNATDLLMKITCDEQRQTLQTSMTGAQIAQAETLAAAWKPAQD